MKPFTPASIAGALVNANVSGKPRFLTHSLGRMVPAERIFPAVAALSKVFFPEAAGWKS